MNTWYRDAEEIFGILQESLGFGTLTMFSGDHGEVTYRCEFFAGGILHFCEETVDMPYIVGLRNFATNLAEQWKDQHGETKQVMERD